MPPVSVTSFCSCVPCSDFWPNAQTDIYISLPLVAPHELCLSSSYHNFAMPYQALALLDMSDLLSRASVCLWWSLREYRGLGLRLWSRTAWV